MMLQSTVSALALLAVAASAFVPLSLPKTQLALHLGVTGDDRRSFVTKVGCWLCLMQLLVVDHEWCCSYPVLVAFP
jgi:hypothetical protein